MKNILVTGGAGYIGSHAALNLAQSGYNVVVYDNFSTGHKSNVQFGDLVEGDIRDKEKLISTFNHYDIGAVIHFAASSLVGESVTSPHKYYDNNMFGSFQLLEAMRLAEVKNIIFSSTCATYGLPKTSPLDENCLQSPINPYGWSKLMIERIIIDYSNAYGMKHGILRYFNAAGADKLARVGENHSPETHLIPLVLDVIKGKREHITIFGNDYNTPDGTCLRDYIHVLDLAEAHTLLLKMMVEHGESGIFNLGNEKGISVLDIIKACKDVTGKDIKSVIGARRAGDPDILIANSSKAKNILGWQPKFNNINEIICDAYNYHKSF